MTRGELQQLEKVTKQLYKELVEFKDIAEILDLSLTDVIYLILADQESKWMRFKHRDIGIIKHIPKL